MTNGEASGQAIADGILKRIALRYKNCMVNIYPDLPELTPVEGVLRCAREEGFVLAARPDAASAGFSEWWKQFESDVLAMGHVTWANREVAVTTRDFARMAWEAGLRSAAGPGGTSAEQLEQDKIGRLTGGKCIEALASRREDAGGASARCGESAGHLIAGASYFACVLPKDHEGEHRRGGTCFAHGEYVGNQCPEWPECVSAALASRREIGEGRLREAIEIVENEPLGYLTERDHEVLENFADRIVAKLQARAAPAGERAGEHGDK